MSRINLQRDFTRVKVGSGTNYYCRTCHKKFRVESGATWVNQKDLQKVWDHKHV